MLQLLNGCHASNFSVHPKNWDKPGASTKKFWYIHYRFYDPAFRKDPKYKHGKLIALRGMNEAKLLPSRRELTKRIINAEKRLLLKGYNPISGQYMAPIDYNFELNPDTPFIRALELGLEKVKAVKGTLTDMKSVVRGVKKAARKLDIDDMAISEVSRKYYKRIFEQCYKDNKQFSPMRHNKYKAYLSKIYKELLQLEVVEVNPLVFIQNEKVFKKERVLLTMEERKIIDSTLYKTNYEFWRALQIFFHSYGRESEMFKVQGKHVDLINQRCKYMVLKGGAREVWRPIKNSVLHLWKELLKDAKPDDYLFSVGLVPGPKHVRPDQLGRRWTKYVKTPPKKDKPKRKNEYQGGLGINVSLYALKHLNVTETMDYLDSQYNYNPAKDVADMCGHKSSAMVVKIYDRRNQERKDERIKNVANSFGG